MSKPFVVGICGGSGAGKTTLLKRLSETFQGASTAVFSMDNYYLPIEQQTKDANGIVNFDLPTALDHQKLTTDLQTLISGQPIEVREYFFNVQGSKSVLLTIQPSDLIIVEGLFTLHYQSVFSQLDFSIFVDVDSSIDVSTAIKKQEATNALKSFINGKTTCCRATNNLLSLIATTRTSFTAMTTVPTKITCV